MDPIEAAERAVLVRIFQHQPGQFVWIGGSVLQVLFRSARRSFDLDLLPTSAAPDLRDIVAEALSDAGRLTGLPLVVASEEQIGPEFRRYRVMEGARVAFTIDISGIPGYSGTNPRAVLMESVLGTAAVQVPQDAELLAQKIGALLLRAHPIPGDLYDVWFLLGRGVEVEQPEALADSLMAAEIDIDERMDRIAAATNWIAPLRRTGVDGLDEATGRVLLETVRSYLKRLQPGLKRLQP
jgi:hypothetical protein